MENTKVSRAIETKPGNIKVSSMIKAMQELADNIDSGNESPKGLFGRRVLLKSGGVKIDNLELDIDFEIPFDDNTEANEAEITVYNLSKNTIQLLKYNQEISITAGYTGDTGVIFSGRISKVTSKLVGADKKTTIYAIDDTSLTERNIASIAYSQGVTASYILKDLLNRLTLPIAAFKPKADYVYKEAVNVDGGIMDNIKKYAKICGISTYILKGKIYAQDVRAGTNAHFTVSTETGMIGSPEPYEEEITEENYKETLKGYTIRMLLQHRVSTAAVITLNSREVKGDFSVKEGRHSYNGTEFITEVTVIA